MATFPSPQSYLASLGGGAAVYELKFDGVDNYGRIGAFQNSPAALRFDFTANSFTVAWLARDDTFANQAFIWHNNVFATYPRAGWYLWYNGQNIVFRVLGDNLVQCDANLSFARYQHEQYVLIVGTWNHATQTAKVFLNSGTYANVTKTQSVIAHAWGTETCVMGSYQSQLTNPSTVLTGGMLQAAVWNSDQSANIADMWNNGVINDWATIPNPPNVLHYRIGADDDPTVTDGIIDRTGNGLHMTLVNGSAGDVAILPQPRW